MILPPPSGQPVHVPNYHVGCLFRTEMSSTVYPRGCGWERDGSTCAVHTPLLFVHVPHLRGVCVRDTNRVRECFLFWGGVGWGVDFMNYLWEYVSMTSQTNFCMQCV